MRSRPTSFQLRAEREVSAFAESRGLTLRWAEEPGELYVGELMLVGRTDPEALTVWLYDDAIDYCFNSKPVNFEAESYLDEASLLSAVLTHLEQLIPPRAPSRA
jgi:hypothetical protein